MKPRTRKWVHAALIAVASSLTETSMQLLNGSFHWERTVVAGVLVGIIARGLGAAISAIATADPPPPPGGAWPTGEPPPA